MIRLTLCGFLVEPVLGVTASWPQQGETSVTKLLNDQIAEGKDGVFTGGKGIMVRTPDFFAGGQEKVVPATFWVNDIKSPNQAYPGNPWCPHGNTDGYYSITWKCDPQKDSWEIPVVSAVLGSGAMSKLMPEFDKIQDHEWGWGVFYAADSNSADLRCRYLPDAHGWDCPGHWIADDGTVSDDPGKKGSGFYDAGNPMAGKDGGGSGCHFDKNANNIDQSDASGVNNLVEDRHCQCNYIFKDDWSHWVQTWIWQTKQKPGFESRTWLAGGGGLAPAWGLDPAICWVNNPRDMIKLQNALWYSSDKWLNYKAPTASSSEPHYWGWNEVPISKAVADDPKNWDAVMIKLPATVNSINDVSMLGRLQLEEQLNQWEKKGTIIPGSQNAGSRPGSYMVVVLEDHAPNDWRYTRKFFCENWSSPSWSSMRKKGFRLVYQASGANSDSNGGGACYIEAQRFSHSIVV
jgi:hypothetical protein